MNWGQIETEKLDRKKKILLTIRGYHHPRADTDHLYVPRKKDGRGLIQTEGTCIVQVMKVMEYVRSEKDPPIEIVGTLLYNTIIQTQHYFK
jgi:hypothetical protein